MERIAAQRSVKSIAEESNRVGIRRYEDNVTLSLSTEMVSEYIPDGHRRSNGFEATQQPVRADGNVYSCSSNKFSEQFIAIDECCSFSNSNFMNSLAVHTQ